MFRLTFGHPTLPGLTDGRKVLPTYCPDCGEPRECRTCADCGHKAEVLDCGHFAQPAEIAASQHGSPPDWTCGGCEEKRIPPVHVSDPTAHPDYRDKMLDA